MAALAKSTAAYDEAIHSFNQTACNYRLLTRMMLRFESFFDTLNILPFTNRISL